MKQSKLILIVYIALLNITIISLILFNSENDTKLVEKNKETVLKENVFAVMVENEDKTGYVESGSETWPSNMGLNEELTYCKDEKGEIVENPLTIDNGAVTVRTNKKIYCMLYFYDLIPEFTYTGDYEIVDDNDNPITTSAKNWKIRFLTSGTLTFTSLDGAKNGIDVFLVGGGGGGAYTSGGGGGYTNTVLNNDVKTGVEYDVIVGEGGTAYGDGGASSFGISNEYLIANGGKGATKSSAGGAGGSGGGGGSGGPNTSGAGGSNGSNGTSSTSNVMGGIGQGTTTREFSEESGTLYAGGGGGGAYSTGSAGNGGAGGGGNGGKYTTNGQNGKTNFGGGGGGTNGASAGTGGSGIVIIRNARN